MPTDTLVKPASFSCLRYSSSTESGLASVVISNPESKPNVSSSFSSMAIRSVAGRSVGVPPPKKTVESFLLGIFEFSKTSLEKSISLIRV